MTITNTFFSVLFFIFTPVFVCHQTGKIAQEHSVVRNKINCISLEYDDEIGVFKISLREVFAKKQFAKNKCNENIIKLVYLRRKVKKNLVNNKKKKNKLLI